MHPEIASYLQVPQLLACIYWCTCRQLGPCTHLMHHMSDPSDMCMVSILTNDQRSVFSYLGSYIIAVDAWTVWMETYRICQYM